MNIRSTNERWKKKKEAAEEGEQATRKLEIKVEALGAGGEMENRETPLCCPKERAHYLESDVSEEESSWWKESKKKKENNI